MVSREKLIAWLNSIQWLSRESVTQDALELIEDYLARVRLVIRALEEEEQLTPTVAHLCVATAGHDSPCGDLLIDELSDHVTFKGAEVREQLIGVITAAYCWEFDPTLKNFPNPWPPVMELIGLGYTCTFDDEEDESGTSLSVGHKNGIVDFRIV